MKFLKYIAWFLNGLIFVLALDVLHVHARHAKDTSALCIECHMNMEDFIKPNIHQPVKDGKCTVCHNPHTSKFPGLLNSVGSELCYGCHKRHKGFTGKVVHKPVEEGNCLLCHDAHSSENSALVKESAGDGCFSCHPKQNVMARKNIHPEVKNGNCTKCHDPHASSIEGLLVEDRAKLCVRCHRPAGKIFKKAHMRYDVAGTDCTGCHSHHSSSREGLLKSTLHKPFEENRCSSCHRKGSSKALLKAGSALCTKCHKETMAGFKKIFSHLVAGMGDNPCDSCHDPHGSDEMFLLKDKEQRVCYVCHSDTKEFVSKSNHIHPKLDKCSDCHTSHGSNNRYFLTNGDDTCSTAECHPTQGVFTHPVGEKIIDPRSGLPMTCNTCHSPMGSPESFILRFEKERELCIKCHQV